MCANNMKRGMSGPSNTPQTSAAQRPRIRAGAPARAWPSSGSPHALAVCAARVRPWRPSARQGKPIHFHVRCAGVAVWRIVWGRKLAYGAYRAHAQSLPLVYRACTGGPLDQWWQPSTTGPGRQVHAQSDMGPLTRSLKVSIFTQLPCHLKQDGLTAAQDEGGWGPHRRSIIATPPTRNKQAFSAPQ